MKKKQKEEFVIVKRNVFRVFILQHISTKNANNR